MNDRLYDVIEKDLDSIVSPSSEMVPSWQAHLHQTVESDSHKLLTAVSCAEIIVIIIKVVVVIILLTAVSCVEIIVNIIAIVVIIIIIVDVIIIIVGVIIIIIVDVIIFIPTSSSRRYPASK